MLAAPTPANEPIRLQASRATHCAYAPREERFDRITRTAKRVMNVPIALISIVEQDEQWFRSVQGLDVDHTARDISFCGHAVAANSPLCIPDTLENDDFRDNPLVTGPPRIRSYLGWPLEIAPGLAVGTLCVIDTMPRTFGREDFEALRDLAHMAEAELRLNARENLQDRMMMRFSRLQRRGALDPVTGCWNIRGFRELLALALDDARASGSDLAICNLQVQCLDHMVQQSGGASEDALVAALAQVLRQRLPENGALARLGTGSFCALVPAGTALALEEELAMLTYPKATLNLGQNQVQIEIPLNVRIAWLAEMGPGASAGTLWAHALSIAG
ncbi:MAG: GAF domain-containing protein [Comamonadaceae bacterium]|nr:MAG: GAF domain-containing protein [Comamonadaceae bacterium]